MGHSVDRGRGQESFEGLIQRIAGGFAPSCRAGNPPKPGETPESWRRLVRTDLIMMAWEADFRNRTAT